MTTRKVCSMTDYSPIVVAVPGTCGELIQGWYTRWQEAVLVSCPIACYSRVSVWLCPEPHLDVPISHFKAAQAARLLLDTLGQPDVGARVRLSSQLLPSRGMASSTADVVGVMVALALALGTSLSPGDLARLACQIEPSDSTMFPGLTMLAYRGSSQAQPLGPVPPLALVMLDPDEPVDTLAYNAQLDISAVRNLAATTQAALDMLHQGLANNNAAAIGAAATLSATSYQAISYTPLLPVVQDWAVATKALGVVRAHSGSVLGLLYPPGADLAGPIQWLSSRFKGVITPTHLTSGGYLLMSKPESLLGLTNTTLYAIF